MQTPVPPPAPVGPAASSVQHDASPAPSEATTSSRSPSPQSQQLAVHTDLYYFQQRCSICFEAQLDFCLERCRDQFCRGCFSRYVQEVVRSSWGMALTKVKCPVCSDVLARHEWAKLVQTYDRNNQPYKCLTRGCPQCFAEMKAATNFVGSRDDREEIFLQAHDLIMECLGRDDHEEFLNDYLSLCYRHLNGNTLGGPVTATDIYRFVMDKLSQPQTATKPRQTSQSKRRRVVSLPSSTSTSSGSPFSPVPLSPESPSYNLEFPALRSIAQLSSPSRISALLLSLEDRPEEWRTLQFEHIAKYPKFTCDKCRTQFCFQCGESTWHNGMTCLEFMKQTVTLHEERQALESANYTTVTDKMLTRNSLVQLRAAAAPGPETSVPNADDIANMKWKLANSKSCPRCCILINRDDGCNKVDCTMCGMRFCWVCKSAWSEKCGFYRCQEEMVTSALAETLDKSESTEAQTSSQDSAPSVARSPSSADAPELGVPDVARIQARLSVSHARA